MAHIYNGTDEVHRMVVAKEVPKIIRLMGEINMENKVEFLAVQSGKDEINWSAVREFILDELEDVPDAPLKVKQFSAGYSNLTYAIEMGDWKAVLRRPPFGPIPPKAHDMKREAEILQRIHPVFPLAPKVYLYSEDPALMDRPFYIMERKQGVVLDDEFPPEYEANEETARKVSETVVNTMTQLHAIDYVQAELTDIGRPDGYLERQVHGWIKRYHAAQTDEIAVTGEVEAWLVGNIPASPAPTIVHNDFKLNNMMLAADDPRRATAVFDWEMCTIGDPLTDLASTMAYWTEPGEGETGLTSITTFPGFITRREFIDFYAQKSGRDVGNIDYYLTFAFYKVGVILQQIYYRWKQGGVQDERFGKLDSGVYNLMHQAHRAMRRELL
jgi:aminoglycoside phosphotransferase (APT) family kinase protein